jgi:hypothetical protein
MVRHSCPYGYNKSSTSQYVALLRGMNVGGKHLIKMTELACLGPPLGCKRLYPAQQRSFSKPLRTVQADEADRRSVVQYVQLSVTCGGAIP